MEGSISTAGALDPADQQLVDGVIAKQRRALAKTITLIESTRDDHQARAQKAMGALLPHTGNAIRVGISGVPGAGKSTFIEALGNYLIDEGHKLAVLAVDPSSSVSGGSILGDKTRMESLCQREEAFIRPSPSAGSLGGVAEKTREAMLVCVHGRVACSPLHCLSSCRVERDSDDVLHPRAGERDEPSGFVHGGGNLLFGDSA